jgi:hypothetical protein
METLPKSLVFQPVSQVLECSPASHKYMHSEGKLWCQVLLGARPIDSFLFWKSLLSEPGRDSSIHPVQQELAS